MLVLNFAHPLTPDQRTWVGQLVGAPPEVRDIPTQADRTRLLAEVAHELADAVGLTPAEWQGRPLIVNPPGLAPLAVALLAEIHGRCGHFPALLHIRPVPGAVPPQYEVAEVCNLQDIRDTARTRRQPRSTRGPAPT